MKKTTYYCDLCKREMLKGGNQLTRKNTSMNTSILYGHHVDIFATVSTEAHTNDICDYCIIDAVNSLDDRPKIAT